MTSSLIIVALIAAAPATPEPTAESADPQLELELLLPEVPPAEGSPLAPQPAVTRGAGAEERSVWRLYTGAGLLGAGLSSLGLAAWFGHASTSARDRVHYGPGGTPQPTARELFVEANRQATRANLSFLAAGVLGVVGSVLLGWELVSAEP